MSKQVIVIRKDLNMRKGKMVAQGAHASLAAILNLGGIYPDKQDGFFIPLNDPHVKSWIFGNFAKITVGCDSEEELLELRDKAYNAKLPHALITDSGKTEFHNIPTITALAIGPANVSDIDKITGHLKLL